MKELKLLFKNIQNQLLVIDLVSDSFFEDLFVFAKEFNMLFNKQELTSEELNEINEFTTEMLDSFQDLHISPLTRKKRELDMDLYGKAVSAMIGSCMFNKSLMQDQGRTIENFLLVENLYKIEKLLSNSLYAGVRGY